MQAQSVELESYTTDKQVATLLANSLTLQSREVAYERTARDLGIEWTDNTRITASADSTLYLADDAVQEDKTVASIDLSQALTPKLSVGAQLTTDEKTVLSLSYQPFASEWVTPQQTYSYEQAKIQYDYEKEKVVDTFATNVADYFLAAANLKLAEESFSLAKLTETSLNEAAALGEASTDEIIEAQRETLDAQQTVLSAQMSLAEETLTVEQALGGSAAELAVPTLDELVRLVEQRQRILDSLSDSISTSQTLKTLEAELTYLESAANAINTFDSDLTFSTSYEVEDQIFKAGVTVNLSPSNWNNEQKLDSALDISMQQQEIEQAQATLALQVQLQQQRVKLETESVQVAQLGVEQQVRNLEEAEYLLELGERTALEVAEQKLALSEAQLAYTKALYSLMDAQQTLSRFFPS
jgi:hypothetical protein